jgi:hypothetical protein
MRKNIVITFIVLCLSILAWITSSAANASAAAQLMPTITPMPTIQANVYYIFEVEIAYRGALRGVVRTTTIRDKASVTGADLGQYRPYTKWWCDDAIPEGENIWCKLSAQNAYIPLKYNGVYYTDWRE